MTEVVNSVASAFTLMSFSTLPPRGGGESRSKYPFHVMKPGQMFFIPLDANASDAVKDKLSRKVSTSASQNGRVLTEKRGEPIKFAVRSIERDGVEGFGVYCLRPADADESDDEGATETVDTGTMSVNEGEGASA